MFWAVRPHLEEKEQNNHYAGVILSSSRGFLSHKLHPFFGVYFTLSPTASLLRGEHVHVRFNSRFKKLKGCRNYDK